MLMHKFISDTYYFAH